MAQAGADGQEVAGHQVFGPRGLEFELNEAAGGDKIRVILEPQGVEVNEKGAVPAVKSRQLFQGAEQNRILFLLDLMEDMAGIRRFAAGKKAMGQSRAEKEGQQQQDRG